ncbi:hypothetical protein MKX01_032939 [Papaver californicum]|nr:hypothetical protein MKX01_032939 [Papaver californicum]
MAFSFCSIHHQVMIDASANKPSVSPNFGNNKVSLDSTVKPFLKTLQKLQMKVDFSQVIKNARQRLLDAFVDNGFQFIDQPLLPSQANFAPIHEIGDAQYITSIEGNIPDYFPNGIYIRNGPNPLFGGFKLTTSIFGRSSHCWIEGEGMVHALYFIKDSHGSWIVSYRNKYVETESFKIEKQRNRSSFLPAIEGDSTAILAAYFFNLLRFGKFNKVISNTNVFEHAKKFYSIAENYVPQEIDINTLKTLGNWDIDGTWDRPFTSHPKKAPGTGELIVMGVDAVEPFFVLGVISADGKKLVHKVDLKFKRSSLCHELGITQRYNVIMDMPLTLSINRLIKAGPLIKYDKEGYARIGVMPRYGDADSVQWFQIKPHCTFHIINCFEDGNEVVVRGCRARASIIPGPEFGLNKFEWFSRGFNPITTSEDGSFLSQVYEWRLNMKNGEVSEHYLTDTSFSMDFPMINENYSGIRNKYGYLQVVDSIESSSCGMPKYGMVAKLHFDEQSNSTIQMQDHSDVDDSDSEKPVKVEYHNFGKNTYCSGAVFVSNPEHGSDEDDGWLISYVHNEDTNISQVHIIDTKKFESEPVAKITLPQRVPYGFHGLFASL